MESWSIFLAGGLGRNISESSIPRTPATDKTKLQICVDCANPVLNKSQETKSLKSGGHFAGSAKQINALKAPA